MIQARLSLLLAGALLLAVTGQALAAAALPPISDLINRNIRSSTIEYNRLSVAPAAVPSPQLWVHVRSDAEKQLVQRNMPWLSSQSFDGRPVVVKSVVLVSVGPSVNQLRFFKAEDRQSAGALAAAMTPLVPNLQLLDLSGSYGNVSWVAPGRLELWLAPNMSQFGPKH